MDGMAWSESSWQSVNQICVSTGMYLDLKSGLSKDFISRCLCVHTCVCSSLPVLTCEMVEQHCSAACKSCAGANFLIVIIDVADMFWGC